MGIVAFTAFMVFCLVSFQVHAQCDGVPSSGKEFDNCGVCGGNNACVCDARNPTFRLDRCGYCGLPSDKYWEVCVGCDGVPGSGLTYDLCGVCDGANACSDCGVVGGKIPLRDVCGVCGGNNLTCVGCDGVPRSNKKEDRCGVCGGTNSSCDKCKQTSVCGDTCELNAAGNVPLFCDCARKHVLCLSNDNATHCEPLPTLCNSKDALRGTYAANCPGICSAVSTTATTATATNSMTTTNAAVSLHHSVASIFVVMIGIFLS